ncbi:MAG: serine hydrolase domain-containing protein [Gemmatimonadaceae bacterium]
MPHLSQFAPLALVLLVAGCVSHPSSQVVQSKAAPGAIPIQAAVRQAVTRLDGRVLTPDSVERIVTSAMHRADVPALAVAIISHGEIAYMGGFGYRDVAARLPLTDTTVMYAASLTKAMFAYLVLQLVRDGTLVLDTPIGSYLPKPLPEYEKYNDLASDPRWRLFTPRMLLSHTSGLPNWRFLRADEKLNINFEPGTRYSYSGEGINLLQFVIELHTGTEVGDMMQTRVFKKLGMTRTQMTWNPAFESEYALGYDSLDAPVRHRRRNAARAAGSADTDVADMAQFLRAVLRQEGPDANLYRGMLSPQIRIHSLHEFPAPSSTTTDRDDAIALSYGLGWGLYQSRFGPAFFKEGHDDQSWRNVMVGFNDSKTGVVFLSSSAHAEPMFPVLLAELIGDTDLPAEWMGYGSPEHVPK